MKVLPINHYQNINNSKSMPSFKSATRIYYNTSVDNTWENSSISTLSMIFRNDIDWMKLANIIHTNFQDKNTINSYCLACSDGSEAYTYKISLIETAKDKDISKFSTIIGVDKDAEIISAAQSGRINLSPFDIKKMQEFKQQYFVNPDTPLAIKNNTQNTNSCFSYQPIDMLTDNVKFIKDDIINTIKNIDDNGNTVILCRNVAPYLSKSYQHNLVKTLEQVLKRGSLFVIGKFDTMSEHGGNMGNLMNLSRHFQQIDKYIYRKI